MENEKDETLSNVTVFEKPKYAISFSKDGKDYLVDELWGAGMCDGSYYFLFVEFGCLQPFTKDDFVLLNDLPSPVDLETIQKYHDEDEDLSLFTANNYMRTISREKQIV